MKTSCDLVAERVALGEPLGDVAEHAAGCPRCRRLAALPAELGAAHRDVDPGLGFTARMTAGAQHRVVVRRRRRLAAGLAAAVATTVLGVFVVTRPPDATPQVASQRPATTAPAPAPSPAATRPDPWDPDHHEPTDGADPDVATLVHLADLDRSTRLSADWGRIERPLAPYRTLLEGVTP